MASKKLAAQFEIENPFSEKLDSIAATLDRIEQTLIARIPKNQVFDEPVAQIDAILMLRTTYPTFKKLISHHKIKPIKRGGRLFYRPEDVTKLINGGK